MEEAPPPSTGKHSEPDPAPGSAQRPPRAFTQGVGTVFQVVGVLLFLLMMTICCGSGLLSPSVAEHTDLTQVGWGTWLDTADAAHPVQRPVYSGQRAVTICVTCAVVFGMALAGLGLGLQAQNRAAPAGALAVTAFASVFWLVHLVFFVQKLPSVLLGILGCLLFALFATLTALAAVAWREMRRNPPAASFEILPADYKVPYSHLHEDPPDVRLAKELEQRRQRLAVQQKELEMLEQRMKRRFK